MDNIFNSLTLNLLYIFVIFNNTKFQKYANKIMNVKQ